MNGAISWINSHLSWMRLPDVVLRPIDIVEPSTPGWSTGC